MKPGWAASVKLALLGALTGALTAAEGDPEPLFVDVSDTVGLTFEHRHGESGRKYLPETMGAGGCVLDFDGDGWMDVYLVQSGKLGEAAPNAVNRLFRNRGDGSFEDVSARAGAVAHRGYGQGAVAADFDGDGHTDIYVTNVGPDVLLRNRGNGSFEDVTVAAGLGNAAWGSSAAFFDADADGDLDLYVVNYLDFTLETHRDCRHKLGEFLFYCHPDAYPMAADVFYRNRGDGTFEDATQAAGLRDRTGKGLGVVTADFDDDGRPDLYVANDSTPNFLYRNLGGGRFEEVGLFVGVSHNEEGKTEAGMGVDAGDVNGDGRLDLFVTNLSLETNALYVGGKDFFDYATRKAGLHSPSLRFVGFGTDLADLDNDGDLDILVINGHVLDNVEKINDGLTWRQPGQVFEGDGTGAFTELSAAAVGDLATPRVGRGSLTFDADNDGRLDLLVSYNNDRARLYQNRGVAGEWIGFELVGKGKNPGGVGARVTVEVGGRKQVDEVKAGSSYLSSGDPRLHFGLGKTKVVDKVTVRWGDGSRQTFTGLAAGRYHRLEQGR